MSEPQQLQEGNTDVAALAGGVVATSISLSASAGEYGMLSLLTSLALLPIIYAYIWPHKRTSSQSVAAGAAIALAALPGMGYIFETGFAVTGYTIPLGSDTRVSDTLLGMIWLVTTIAVYTMDRKSPNN